MTADVRPASRNSRNGTTRVEPVPKSMTPSRQTRTEVRCAAVTDGTLLRVAAPTGARPGALLAMRSGAPACAILRG